MPKSNTNWAEWPIETEEQREALAVEIARFMDDDTTEPTDGDRNKWLSDVRLRALESKVVQGEAKFGEFANLCWHAGLKTYKPHAHALLGLGYLNGERRKLDDRDDQLIGVLIRGFVMEIAALPDGPRKDRLEGLLDYHCGIYARVVGDYRLAASLQHKSAEKAEQSGDMGGFAISSFCEAVELVSAALVDGNTRIIRWRLENLKAAGRFLQDVADEASRDPTMARWLGLNLPVHLIFAYFWANEWMDPLYTGALLQMLEQYVAVPENAAHVPVQQLCRAIQTNDHRIVQKVWDGEVVGETHPECKATAGLFLARAEQYDVEGGFDYYDAVINMDGPCHVVRAVARRELYSLKNPD